MGLGNFSLSRVLFGEKCRQQTGFLAQLGIPVKSWAVPGHFQEGARGAV